MNQQKLMTILLGPRISEKSTLLADKHRQFVFQVALSATRIDVQKAVELMFEVEVDNVQILNVKGKKKRFGARHGMRSGWKKAYVSLKPGHDIDFLGPQ